MRDSSAVGAVCASAAVGGGDGAALADTKDGDALRDGAEYACGATTGACAISGDCARKDERSGIRRASGVGDGAAEADTGEPPASAASYSRAAASSSSFALVAPVRARVAAGGTAVGERARCESKLARGPREDCISEIFASSSALWCTMNVFSSERSCR